MSLHDLNKSLENWVKKYGGFSEDDLKEGLVWFEIDTTKLRVITEDKPSDKKDKEGGHGEDKEEVNEDDLHSGVVFKSKYTNKTNVPQEHTFIMEKQTEATLISTLTKGFTADGKVGIKVKVPDVVTNATSSFGTEVTIATDDMSIVKHLVDWSSQTKVIVAPRETVVAEVRIKETKYKVKFDWTVVMKGRVIARVYRAERKHPKVMESTLATILSNDETVSLMSGVYIKMETGQVTWDVSGTLHFRFGVSQDCEVCPLEK
ncbi:uncharacterized protein [Haliotis asinina]|uniref:uncharacterized protein n=1 Tax=Haliotis asinina TaxID=109174 RepID=UPI003531F3F9